MPKPDKKQRQRAKRDAKRTAVRRRDATSPWKRLVDAPGEAEYWMSSHFESLGQAQAFAFKQAGGQAGVACFLVDRGVVGLKDAWARVGITRKEFDDILRISQESGARMTRVRPDAIRDVVGGGVRWAQSHGMRLPPDWVKAARLLGGAIDPATADVSAFVKEFAGHPEDLRQRLIGEPYGAFVQRPDINFIFNTNVTYMDQDSGDYIDPSDDLASANDDELKSIAVDISQEELDTLRASVRPIATTFAEETQAWLSARGETASTMLIDAWTSMLVATDLAKTAMPGAPRVEVVEFWNELISEMAGSIRFNDLDEYESALGQASEHLESSPQLIERFILKSKNR